MQSRDTNDVASVVLASATPVVISSVRIVVTFPAPRKGSGGTTADAIAPVAVVLEVRTPGGSLAPVGVANFSGRGTSSTKRDAVVTMAFPSAAQFLMLRVLGPSGAVVKVSHAALAAWWQGPFLTHSLNSLVAFG